MATTTKKLSVSINSDLYDAFEKMRKKYGKDNRSKEVQKAIEMRVKQWKRQELEEQCKRAQGRSDFPIEETYEAQGEAFKSKFE